MPDTPDDLDPQQEQLEILIANMITWIEDHQVKLLGVEKGAITINFTGTHVEGDVCARGLRLKRIVARRLPKAA